MVEALLIILWSIFASIGQGQNVVGVGFAVVVPRIADAINRTRIEQDQLTAERKAFDEFTKRVDSIDLDKHTHRGTNESRSPTAGTGVTTVTDPMGYRSGSAEVTESASASVIREAYRDTIMAVPHYEENYGEPINENLTAELGPEQAQALTKSDVLTPQLQATILSQAQQASKQRNDLLSHVETEYESLVDARRQLRDLHETATTIEENLYPRPVRELVQSWDRLETAVTDCETLLRERQTHLQREQLLGKISMCSLQEYLYQPFQWRHPVLSDGLETLRRIRHAKQETIKAIYNW